MNKTILISIFTLILIVSSVSAIDIPDVVYYKLDSDGTDTAGHYGLTLAGSPSFVDGIVDKCMNTTDSDEGVNTSAIAFDIRTIDFWFNIVSIPVDAGIVVLGQSGDNDWLFFRIETDGVLRVALKQDGVSYKWDLLSSTGVIDFNTWYQVVVTMDTGGVNVFLNGNTTPLMSDADTSFPDSGSMGAIYVAGGGEWDYTGAVDNLAIWTDTKDTAYVTESYNGGNGREFQGLPTITLVSPANNKAFNSDNLDNLSSINVSANQNITDWTINDTRWGTFSTTNTTASFNNSDVASIPNGNFHINITANNSNGLDSLLFNFTIDITDPEATSNIDNQTFTAQNFTAQINYTDNRDLFKVNVSLDNKLFLTVTGLSGTFFSLNITVTPENLSTLSIGNERINISTTVCDSHTDKIIPEYSVTKEKDKILFDELYIKSKQKTKEMTYSKKSDRYTFSIEYEEPKEWIELEINEECIYRPQTKYDGHFVCGNKWIDFEGDHDVYVYGNTVIIVPDEPRTRFDFNSVGELNCNEVFLGFYDTFNTTVVFNPTAFEGTLEEIKLVIDCEPGVGGTTANLIYNNTVFPTTRSDGAGQANFTALALTPLVSEATNISFFLNFTINEPTERNTSENNQTVTTWNIDDCSTFTDTLFNFEVRDERNNSLIQTDVNFNFIYQLENNTEINKTFQVIRTGQTNYTFCRSPDNISIIAVVMSNIMTRTNYGGRTFTLFDFPLTGTITAFLLEDDTDSKTVTFTFIDTGNTPVENARVSIFKDINGTQELVQRADSDFAGQIVAFLDELVIYFFTVNASGFPFKTFNLQPINTAYTITLTTIEESFYINPYDGIRYRLRHNGVIGIPDIINVSDDFQNITLELEGSNLIEVGLNLSNHDYECIPSNCFNSISSANGGSVTVSIKANETGRFNTAYFFRISGRNRIYLNDGLIKVVPFIFSGTDSLLDLIEDMKRDTSPNIRTVLVAFVSVAAIGVGSSIGLIGFLLILPVLAVNIFFSLPQVAFIHPLLGGIISVFGVGMYLFSQMRAS